LSQGTIHANERTLPAEEPFAWIANHLYDFDLMEFPEDLQFTKYGAGTFLTWNQDGLAGDLTGCNPPLVQLSDLDDAKGSNLELCSTHTAAGLDDHTRVAGSAGTNPTNALVASGST